MIEDWKPDMDFISKKNIVKSVWLKMQSKRKLIEKL